MELVGYYDLSHTPLIHNHLKSLIEQLQNGELPGDKVAGTLHNIFKIRIQNSDIQKGKSGGYRVIYYVQISTRIVLVTVYSKSDQPDIAADEIDSIIAEFENQGSDS
jgi:mRNA-degrading endonuclease RelE of RelBE toxin-antitoxin system